MCKNLVSYAINELCVGDGQCVKACPSSAISGVAKGLYTIEQSKCIQCDACYQVCKFDSIQRVKRGEAETVQAVAKTKWKPLKEREKAPVGV